MKTSNKISLIFIICSGIILMWLFAKNELKTPLGSTLTPVFSMVGTPVKAVENAVSHSLPINNQDEKNLGEEIAKKYSSISDCKNDTCKYLNNLIDILEPFAKKSFNYKVFLLQTEMPNAMALPGGVILVTQGLVNTMENEGQLVAVLAHEMGHIESSHCMNIVKFNLLSKKIGLGNLGKLADKANSLLISHSYSKIQEEEADSFAYKMLLETSYDPSALGDSLNALDNKPITNIESNQKQQFNIIRDYFMSHPPLPLRVEKYREKADMWWASHKNAKRYIGGKNKTKLKSIKQKIFKNEWITYKSKYESQTSKENFWKE